MISSQRVAVTQQQRKKISAGGVRESKNTAAVAKKGDCLARRSRTVEQEQKFERDKQELRRRGVGRASK